MLQLLLLLFKKQKAYLNNTFQIIIIFIYHMMVDFSKIFTYQK